MPIVRESKPLTAQDMDEMVSAIDALVSECEKTIIEIKDKEVRTWFLGNLQGLRLAQSFARRVWPANGTR